MRTEGEQQQPMSVKDQIRAQKRAVDRSKRQLERQQKKMEYEKKKMMTQIKKMAEKGQHSGAKMVARQIVQTTNQINKMTEFIGQLGAVSLRISACSCLNELVDAMDQAGKAMGLVSSKMDGGKFSHMLKNFEKADMKMEMSQEMIGDILEDMNNEEDAESSEELYRQVLQDVGLNANEVLPGSKDIANNDNNKVEEDSLDAMLKSLNNH